MKTHEWLDGLRQRLAALPAEEQPYTGAHGQANDGSAMLRGLAGRSPELTDVQEEVATEQQGRVALASLCGELNCWLLAALREQAPLPAAQPVTREGFFTLVALPNTAALPSTNGWDDVNPGETSLEGMDCILYLSDYARGWQPDEDRWYARLRAAGAPVLPVLIRSAGARDPSAVPDEIQNMLESMRRHLGVKPVFMSRDAGLQEHAIQELVSRVLELRPRLAIPLAQEVPACRQLIARRVIRTAAFMAGLLGIEPVPLLDLPLTVLVQWKMALQLAAIYGRPGVEVFSREMAGTVGINLIARTLAQQGLKLLPIFGWLLSAALNFSSTWLLGQALLNAYAEETYVRLPTRLARLTTKAHMPAWPRGLRLPRRQRKDDADV